MKKPILILILFLALALTACAGQTPAPEPTATEPAVAEPAPSETAPAAEATPTTASAEAGSVEPAGPAAPPGCTVVSMIPTPDPAQDSRIAAVSEQDWSKGPAEAEITIIEYGDFQ